jgi:hypothetical protein
LTAAVPEVVAMNVEVQVAEAVVPARLHVVNVPVTPVWVRVTVPVGVVAPVLEVSVTVTVQVDPWLATTRPVQETVVDVIAAGVFTVTLAVPPLEL